MEIELIGCRGGKKEVPKILKSCDWKYGSRSDYYIYDQPHFIDINWKCYNWLNHWQVVRKWQPHMAMVADYEHPNQKEKMLRQIKTLDHLNVIPMVCPKFNNAVLDVPNHCIIAISVPTRHAGFLPKVKEIKGKNLHLLGGHPDQYIVLSEIYNQSNIISGDCSAIFLKAMYGAFWNNDISDWKYTEKRVFSTEELIKKSATNIKEFFNNPPDKKRFSIKRTTAIYSYFNESIFA